MDMESWQADHVGPEASALSWMTPSHVSEKGDALNALRYLQCMMAHSSDVRLAVMAHAAAQIKTQAIFLEI